MLLDEPLRHHTVGRPNHPALVTPERTISYRHLDRMVDRHASHLRSVSTLVFCAVDDMFQQYFAEVAALLPSA